LPLQPLALPLISSLILHAPSLHHARQNPPPGTARNFDDYVSASLVPP
jgi:hypothetical protein